MKEVQYHLSVECIGKGYLLCQKIMIIQNGKGLDLGAEPSRISLQNNESDEGMGNHVITQTFQEPILLGFTWKLHPKGVRF